MKQQEYAYGRVSSIGQNEARQVQKFLKLGIPKKNIIIEKVSGKSFNRSGYQKLLKIINPDDILYIDSISRLGRDYDGIISEWHRLTKELKVIIKVIESPILDTDKKPSTLIEQYLKDITLLTLAFQASQEWVHIKDSQRAGIAIAKQNGKHLGRPRNSYSKNEIKVVNAWQNGLLSLNEAMQKLGRKKSAFYRLVRELK